MAGATSVSLKVGDQPRNFLFGNPFATPLVTSIIANQNSLPLYREAVYATYQAIVTGTGIFLFGVNIALSQAADWWYHIPHPSWLKR